MLKEFNEGLAIFVDGGGIADRIRPPVESAEYMLKVAVTVAQGQVRLVTSLHPTGTQRILQAHGCFVHKEKLKIAGCGPFFKSRSKASASERACESWKASRLCFGRRYT